MRCIGSISYADPICSAYVGAAHNRVDVLTAKGDLRMPVARGQKGVAQEMRKFKKGELHSGSKKGPVVKDRKQAIAISLNEAGLSKPSSTLHHL
jgi:hypothetical protein